MTLNGCTLAGRRRRRRLAGLLAGAVVVAALAGCGEDVAGPSTPTELRGPAVAVGNGTAQLYVTKSTGGVQSVGIRLSAGALSALPDTAVEWLLALPAGVNAAPWDHAMLDWNPQGHEPVAIYGVPHFDFHFYTVPVAEQMAIAGGPDTTTVPAANVPRDYASQVISVPAMGVHWADTTAAEFHGHPFDRTFIYGFSHGTLVFVEPMVTRAYLQSQPDSTAPVKQPQAFQQPGLYPTSYRVSTDAGTGAVSVALTGLTPH